MSKSNEKERTRWYVSQADKREQKVVIRTCRCIISFTIDSIGDTYDASVGDDGLVGEGDVKFSELGCR